MFVLLRIIKVYLIYMQYNTKYNVTAESKLKTEIGNGNSRSLVCETGKGFTKRAAPLSPTPPSSHAPPPHPHHHHNHPKRVSSSRDLNINPYE